MKGLSPRHGADKIADELVSALDRWPDQFDTRDRDHIGEIVHVLRTIAETVPARRGGAS